MASSSLDVWAELAETARREFITRAISSVDHMRRSPGFGPVRKHKEWQHFVILTPEIDLLVNFSSCDDVRPQAGEEAEFPRVIVLARTTHWDGDVDTFAVGECNIRGGLIDMTLAHNRLVFEDGCFHISVAMRQRPISMELRLVPRTVPVYVPRIRMIEGPLLNWTVVPRLDVYGTVNVGDRSIRLDGAPAYHDHNWGPFFWGHDCAWEWGFVLPDDPAVRWSLTFVRLADRARTKAIAQSLLLWKGDVLDRVFFEKQVDWRPSLEFLRLPRIFKVPRPMALLAPEAVADVPRRVEVTARNGDDWVEVHGEPYDLAQVLIPSEARLGVTIFNEAASRAVVRGRARGEDFSYTGKSTLEFIRVY